MEEKAGIVVARGLAKFLVGGSVLRVTKQIVKNNVNSPENRREKIRIAVATYALSGLVADQATQWIEKEFNSTVERIQAWHQKAKDAAAEETPKDEESPEPELPEQVLEVDPPLDPAS